MGVTGRLFEETALGKIYADGLPGLGGVPGQHQAKLHVQAIFENLPISFKVNLLMYYLSGHLALSTRNL